MFTQLTLETKVSQCHSALGFLRCLFHYLETLLSLVVLVVLYKKQSLNRHTQLEVLSPKTKTEFIVFECSARRDWVWGGCGEVTIIVCLNTL